MCGYVDAHVHISFVAQPTTAAPCTLAERQKKSIFWTTFYDHAPLKCEGVVEELRSGAFEVGAAVFNDFFYKRGEDNLSLRRALSFSLG